MMQPLGYMLSLMTDKRTCPMKMPFASYLLAGIISFINAPCALASSQDNRPVKIILVGDSTTAQGTGWGGAFCDLHVSPMVACLPLGRGGRSSKTYRAEGSWQLAINEMRVPGYAATYVLIELGHNDKNADPAIGTDMNTVFPENIARMVQEARAANATPVLVTPLSARHFRGGKLLDTIAPWAYQVRAVAGKTGTPLVDLNRSSEALYQKLGAIGALGFELHTPSAAEQKAAASGTTLDGRISSAVPASSDMPQNDPRRSYQADYIHLNERGAETIAGLVANDLVRAVPALHGQLR
jgi:lysophospholipase L1-like esterase